MKSNKHISLGKKGEEKAVSFLQNRGYSILEKNWKHKKFEIDIIATIDDCVVFIEVKTRSSAQYEKPYEAVNLKKQRHLIDGAEYYLEMHQLEKEARFDVISIIMIDGKITLEHIPSAFMAEISE